MSSRTNKAAASKKKGNKSPIQDNNARNFNCDLDKLRQLNVSSFSEARIGLKEHKIAQRFLSQPNIVLTSKPVIQAHELLPAPNNSRAPRLGIWKFISKESISVIRQSSAEEARKNIANLLDDKKLDRENHLLTSALILTVLKWAFKRGFNDLKASTLAYCFFSTHEYFLDSFWRNQNEVYAFFKETLIHHTVEDPPLHRHILTIHECKDCLLYFCDTYLQVLPLLRCRLIPNMRIKLSWQDKNSAKTETTTSK